MEKKVVPLPVGTNPGGAGAGTPLKPGPGHQLASFAQGCFWGTEYRFRQVPGVVATAVGYAGGQAKNPTYEQVSDHGTGHAEAVLIEFDPAKVSYARLLEIFWSSHDPTQLNRQGPDVGPSYRSAIFPQSAAQRQVAASFIAQLRAQRPIATRIESGAFFPAEAYHQDFMRRNPHYPYIIANDRPKLAKLKQAYPQYWKA